MIGIYRGIVEEALMIARAPKIDLWVTEAGRQGPFAETSRIPRDTREGIARLFGVAEAGSITYQSIEAFHAGRELRIYVVGYEPGRPGGHSRIVALWRTDVEQPSAVIWLGIQAVEGRTRAGSLYNMHVRRLGKFKTPALFRIERMCESMRRDCCGAHSAELACL